MESKWFMISCFFLVLMSIVNSSNGHRKFHVGGKDGWVLNPSESYNHWAERMRFRVNDTLYFRYKKGSDSVLVVTKADYDSCSTQNPIQSLKDGNSIFKFDRSGPYYFISGHADNCKKNEKLVTVVMAVRNKTRPPSPSPVPAGSPKGGDDNPGGHDNTPANGEVPAPAPANSGSRGLDWSVGSVLGYSVGVCVVLGSFVGMF